MTKFPGTVDQETEKVVEPESPGPPDRFWQELTLISPRYGKIMGREKNKRPVSPKRTKGRLQPTLLEH